MDVLNEMLPILIPYIVLEMGLRIFAIISIIRAKSKGIQLRWDPTLWIIIVAFVNFGWLLYFIIGRTDQ
jgi:hypothetical protein